MAFKDNIKKKVPSYMQGTPEFKVFLALVKKEDIRGPASLKAYLDTNIAKLKADFKEKKKANRNGSMNRRLRPIAKKLDFLKLIKQKILRYL